jgi:hypothetical protein
MATQCKTNGSIGMQAAIGFLYFVAMSILFFVIHRLDVITRQNSATLVRHEAKLAVHDSHFSTIFDGQFSPAFAAKIKRYLPSEK